MEQSPPYIIPNPQEQRNKVSNPSVVHSTNKSWRERRNNREIERKKYG